MNLALSASGGLIELRREFFMSSQPIVLYVLRSPADERRYVGITKNLVRRLGEHRRKQSRGSERLETFELVLHESYPSYLEARAREKFLKSGQGRRWPDEHLPPLSGP
jgi:predicted GIY-YIG superfamily endonuclease